jgi:hypothetical protein
MPQMGDHLREGKRFRLDAIREGGTPTRPDDLLRIGSL